MGSTTTESHDPSDDRFQGKTALNLGKKITTFEDLGKNYLYEGSY